MRYLVTSALPYANGPLHIGHLAGAYLPADIYVRYLRLTGNDVVWVCGSDEHGAAITVRARKEGLTPQEVVDKYHVLLRDTLRDIGISFDIYHRTSSPIHHQTSQDIFRKLHQNGEFSEEVTEQYYDEQAGQFLADRYIIGTCPVCSNPDAYGDQCEKCGSTLSPDELISPRSTLSGAAPVKRPTKHWFLRLDRHEQWLRTWVNTGKLEDKTLHDPNTWKKHVTGQCNSWLDQGLQPRAMTRDLDWGIDVPEELEGSKGKKLYVWLDAPIGYISATKQWAADNGKNWEDYWKDPETRLIHFIGKDNIVFHCLIFPAILKAHGEFILPVNVPANQFMNLEGRKISTSKNWAVWVHEYLAEFRGQEDALRYNMVKNMPEQRDSEFTWKGFQETNNTELVNNLANFVHRVLVLSHKYYGGIIPAADRTRPFKSGWQTDKTGNFQSELAILHEKIKAVGVEIERFNLREALSLVMEISSAGNALLQFNEPWKAAKTDPETVESVMATAAQYVAVLSVIIRPFLPFSSDKLRTMLQLAPLADWAEWQQLLDVLAAGEAPLLPGHPLGQPEHLFSRITDETIQQQTERLQANDPQPPGGVTDTNTSPDTTAPDTSASAFAPIAEAISYDDFAKMDIRTGTILTAEKVEKSKKLLKLRVDIGLEQRTILSGIAEYFAPEAVIGKQVIVLANLAPRLMMGTESQGMILMAEDAAGKLSFVQPDSGWPNGWKVK
jgi:methionyl-tRNA synthetase